MKTYIAIDLKSFYASVECRERGLDPLQTNLVVADESRTQKTICLAVSPSLKAYGIPGRARLFEVVQKMKEVNAGRRAAIHGAPFREGSSNSRLLAEDPSLEAQYIVAPPRMKLYMSYSTQIYQIYLRYVAPEDIHVYSVDEVMMDVTSYLHTYGLSAHDLCRKMIRDVLRETGITATGGIGPNLYLAKIAMDLIAKHMPADEDGVRISETDEIHYRRCLWTHRPLTDFWRVGAGYARKLEKHGMYTMGDIARCSLEDEDLLYDLFGVNAQHLINHAWGYEDATIEAIKAYRPENSSIGSGQVLQEPYTKEKGKLIIREMTDLLVLDLVDKGLVTDQMVLTVGYDTENLSAPGFREQYKGEVVKDRYGRRVPKSAHGSVNLDRFTSSTRLITDAVMELCERILHPQLLIRRVFVTANHVRAESEIPRQEEPVYEQLNLFTDYEKEEKERQKEEAELERERKMQKAVLEIQKKFGKNAVLKGMNLEEGATTIQRNGMVGGHKGT